jgi:hypothetical protein
MCTPGLTSPVRQKGWTMGHVYFEEIVEYLVMNFFFLLF